MPKNKIQDLMRQIDALPPNERVQLRRQLGGSIAYSTPSNRAQIRVSNSGFIWQIVPVKINNHQDRLKITVRRPVAARTARQQDKERWASLVRRLRGKKPADQTVFDILQRTGLIGCLEGDAGSPTDLSTNPDRMKGFGCD